MPNEEIYGVDYNSNGGVSSTGDISIVSGLDNARQAIRNELLTPLGSYPSVDTDYGSEIYNLHGEDLTDSQLQALHVYIDNALKKQERVQSIEDIEFNYIHDGLYARLHVLLVNGSDEIIDINLGE